MYAFGPLYISPPFGHTSQQLYTTVLKSAHQPIRIILYQGVQ